MAIESPERADSVVDRLTRGANSIAATPRRARKVPEFNRDELREILIRPYRLIFRIEERSIRVLAILHYRQILPTDLLQLPW